jgi:hypothetical protein
LLTPIVLPLVVWVAGLLRGLTIWIPPRVVLLQIAENQFVPATAGTGAGAFSAGILDTKWWCGLTVSAMAC